MFTSDAWDTAVARGLGVGTQAVYRSKVRLVLEEVGSPDFDFLRHALHHPPELPVQLLSVGRNRHEEVVGETVVLHAVDEGEADGGGRSDDVLVVELVEPGLDGSGGLAKGDAALLAAGQLPHLPVGRFRAIILWEPFGVIGGGEAVGRPLCRRRARGGTGGGGGADVGEGLAKRERLDLQLRVAAAAHSIMLQWPNIRPSPLLLPSSSNHLIEIISKRHFIDTARLYFTGSLKLRNRLNYDCAIATIKISSGTTSQLSSRSITVSLAEEGGTITCLNSCLFSLEQSDPARPESMVISDTLKAPINRINPSSCEQSHRLPSSSQAPVGFPSSPVGDCSLGVRQWMLLVGGETVNSRGSMSVSGMQRLPIYNIQPARLVTQQAGSCQNRISLSLATRQSFKRATACPWWTENDAFLSLHARESILGDSLHSKLMMDMYAIFNCPLTINQRMQWYDLGSMQVQSRLCILFVIPAFGRSAHTLVNQPDEFVEGQVGRGDYLRLRQLGLSQQTHELFLFPAEQDVVGEGSDQLLPNAQVPLGKGLQLCEDGIHDTVADMFGRDLAESLQHLGQDVMHLILQLLLQLLVQGDVFSLETDVLIVLSAVVLLYEVGRPVGHEDGLEEGVGRLGDAGGIAVQEFQAVVDQLRQLSPLEYQRDVEGKEALVHAQKVLQQQAETFPVRSSQMSVGLCAKLSVKPQEIFLTSGFLSKDGDGDFDEVDVGADGLFLEGLHHCLIESPYEGPKLHPQASHQVLQHLHRPLHIAILVLLGIPTGELATDEGHTPSYEFHHDLQLLMHDAIVLQLLADLHQRHHSPVVHCWCDLSVVSTVLQHQQGLEEESIGCVGVTGDDGEDTTDDLITMEVVTHEDEEFRKGRNHEQSVDFATPTEGLLGLISNQCRLFEGSGGIVEESLDEQLLLLLHVHQLPEQLQKGPPHKSRRFLTSTDLPVSIGQQGYIVIHLGYLPQRQVQRGQDGFQSAPEVHSLPLISQRPDLIARMVQELLEGEVVGDEGEELQLSSVSPAVIDHFRIVAVPSDILLRLPLQHLHHVRRVSCAFDQGLVQLHQQALHLATPEALINSLQSQCLLQQMGPKGRHFCKDIQCQQACEVHEMSQELKSIGGRCSEGMKGLGGECKDEMGIELCLRSMGQMAVDPCHQRDQINAQIRDDRAVLRLVTNRRYYYLDAIGR